MRTIFSLIIVGLLSVACSSGSKKMTNVGNLKEVSVYHKGVYSAQPDKAALKKLKDEGVVAIVNLRSKSEDRKTIKNEEKFAKELGLAYYNVPFPGNKKLTREQVDAVYKIYKSEKKEGKVLIHCSSGNRAAAWFGAHRMLHDGDDLEEAISKAKSVGLNSSKVEQELRDFLGGERL